MTGHLRAMAVAIRHELVAYAITGAVLHWVVRHGLDRLSVVLLLVVAGVHLPSRKILE